MYNESQHIMWSQGSQIQKSASFPIPYMNFVTTTKKKPMAFKAAWLGSKSKEGISTKARLVVILVGRERCVWEEAQGKILERLVYQLLIS